MKKTRFAFIGGDGRQKQAAFMLAEAGCQTGIYGLAMEKKHNNIHYYSELSPELFEADVIMLPIPYKNQRGCIHIIDQNINLLPGELFLHIKPGSVLIYGRQDREISDLCRDYSIKGYDILKEESFSVLNSIPTAEGAIQRAMERTDITLHGARTLILGYGRIGRVLSRMLKGIGSRVTVEARRNDDLAWIKESGYTGIHLNDLDSVLGEQDIIFNTIPSMILDRNRLSRVNPDCIIIDLASRPGGVDYQAAAEFGLSASLDLGLPGIAAPKTAASIICQVTFEILKRHAIPE